VPRFEEVGGAKGFAGIYARHPEAMQAFSVQYGTLWEYGVLEPVLKDLLRIKSATLHNCDF
jgi:hypothetical protein